MKKRIYLVLLSIIVIFFSCKDESGQFEEQLFTNDQISNALRECIRANSDSTLNVLCVVDTLHNKKGYSYYDSEAYRIEIPAAAKQMIDTLIAHDFGGAIDTLTMNINRAAEKCGNKIKSFFLDPLIKSITFTNPSQILRGKNDAITDYVKKNNQIEFMNLLKTSILSEQFNTLEIIPTWTMLQEEYYKITEKYMGIDILDSSAQQMMEGFFKQMAVWEEAVRTDPKLRGKETDWLYRVFATL
jgi:hypothetical protein